MLTYETVRQVNAEFQKLIVEKHNQGTPEDGKNDAMAIVKNYVSEGDYRAISRTITYYGTDYNFGVHAVVRAMLRLISFYSVLDTRLTKSAAENDKKEE